AGRSGAVSTEVTVERRVPGVISSPAAGSTLSGNAVFVFAPTAGMNVSRVYFSVSAPGGSCGSSWVAADADGLFRWSADTTSCGDGAGQVSASVQWADPSGAG